MRFKCVCVGGEGVNFIPRKFVIPPYHHRPIPVVMLSPWSYIFPDKHRWHETKSLSRLQGSCMDSVLDSYQLELKHEDLNMDLNMDWVRFGAFIH